MRKRTLAIMAAMGLAMIGTGAQAQSLPPVAGSTAEFQQGAYLSSVGQEDKGLDLLLRACDVGDAAACADLAQIPEERFALVLKKRPDAPPGRFCPAGCPAVAAALLANR